MNNYLSQRVSLKSATVAGDKVVSIGDRVIFKCDIEQSGTVIDISKFVTIGGIILTLASRDGFRGEYIGGATLHEELAKDCWILG